MYPHFSSEAIVQEYARYLMGADVTPHTPDAESSYRNCVIPVGRPAKVEPIRGEYIPQLAPTSDGPCVCAHTNFCQGLGEGVCFHLSVQSVSLANGFTHSEDVT